MAEDQGGYTVPSGPRPASSSQSPSSEEGDNSTLDGTSDRSTRHASELTRREKADDASTTSQRKGGQGEQRRENLRRRPIPGKGFRKTRSGCFNCKRRRVKCSQARPVCRGCSRMDLVCVYPVSIVAGPPQGPPHPGTVIIPHGPTVAVNLDHLRFFQHFLSTAYPPHPYGSTAVWHNVAALSHDVDFLAHALLGLGAQHLTQFTGVDYSVQALDLRVSAIRGLNNALSRPCLTVVDGDVRYATIIALTYQSAYMRNGLADFLVMMRGWMMISTTLITAPDKSLFRRFTRDAFIESMRGHVGDAAEIGDGEVIDDYCASLKVIQPLCQSFAELKYLSALEKLGDLAKTSMIDVCLEMVPCYALTNKMTEDEFSGFTDPANYTAQVLLAHFLMLDYVLDTHMLKLKHTSFAFCKRVSKSWVVAMAANLPLSYQKYMMWPLSFTRESDLGHA